jgi:hypothetical protein
MKSGLGCRNQKHLGRRTTAGADPSHRDSELQGRVDFQIMRGTHSSLTKENRVDPQLVADHPRHSLDVDFNARTQCRLPLHK